MLSASSSGPGMQVATVGQQLYMTLTDSALKRYLRARLIWAPRQIWMPHKAAKSELEAMLTCGLEMS